jgi:hypothetical protein
MGSLFYVFGSAVGAALTWLVKRRNPSGSVVLMLSGTACGLLGVVMSAVRDTAAPQIEAGLGLFGTAAPLTLCMAPVQGIAGRAAIPSVARRFAATLALALLCGTACSVFGFVAAQSVRHFSSKENLSPSVHHPISVSLNVSHMPNAAAFPRRL